MKNYEINYKQHDSVYKKKKKDGFTGWDKHKKSYKSTKNIICECIRASGLDSNASGLELGCGAGDLTIWLKKLGFRMSGVDISQTAIDWALAKDNEISFQVGNVTNLKAFEDSSFDFVLDGHLLHCIIGEDRTEVFKNVYRILKENGVFIVMSMCQPMNSEGLDFNQETGYLLLENTITRYIPKKSELLAEINKTDFEIHSYFINEDKDGADDFIALLKKTKK